MMTSWLFNVSVVNGGLVFVFNGLLWFIGDGCFIYVKWLLIFNGWCSGFMMCDVFVGVNPTPLSTGA